MPQLPEMPEAALAAADHVLGDGPARLTLLEYGDYECPAYIQAEAAAAQGQFWPMHHLLFAQAHHLTPAALTGYAQ